MALLDTIKNITGMQTYCADDSVVILANKILEDYTQISIGESETFKELTGIDEHYYVPVAMPLRHTITISFLPDSDDTKFLRELAEYLRKEGGYFNIIVSNNGNYVGKYDAYIKQSGDVVVDVEPDNETFIFGCVRDDNANVGKVNVTQIMGSQAGKFEERVLNVGS